LRPVGTREAGRATPVTCVIVDDHPAVVDAVSRVLDARGIALVGEASDGAAGLDLIASSRPEVALVDIRLPDVSGVEIARRLSREGSSTGVLLYTGQGDTALLREGIDAGARGFVDKTSSLDELVRAIEAVAAGGAYVDPVLAAELAGQELAGDVPSLTERERDVLRLLSEGLDYAEIGARLYLSADTVRVDVRRAMTKLDANTRTQAVAEALRHRLIT
jgi:two-component system nitrate/nitrite response regulator NarL